MKKVSPILAGWILGALASAAFMLALAALSEISNDYSRFALSDVPYGFIVWFIWIFLTMIPGVAVAVPIFYMTQLHKLKYSWVVVGVIGVLVMLFLLIVARGLRPSEDLVQFAPMLLGSFTAAAVFWITAVFFRERSDAEQGAAANP